MIVHWVIIDLLSVFQSFWNDELSIAFRSCFAPNPTCQIYVEVSPPDASKMRPRWSNIHRRIFISSLHPKPSHFLVKNINLVSFLIFFCASSPVNLFTSPCIHVSLMPTILSACILWVMPCGWRVGHGMWKKTRFFFACITSVCDLCKLQTVAYPLQPVRAPR